MARRDEERRNAAGRGRPPPANRRRAGSVDRLRWGRDAFGCWGARFCSNARIRRAGWVLQRREAVPALQHYEEDNMTRDDCADQCHAEGLFVWAEGRLLQAISFTSHRGWKDPWHGHAFCFGYKTRKAVAESPGVYSTPSSDKGRQSRVICDTPSTNPTLRGHGCSRHVRCRV